MAKKTKQNSPKEATTKKLAGAASVRQLLNEHPDSLSEELRKVASTIDRSDPDVSRRQMALLVLAEATNRFGTQELALSWMNNNPISGYGDQSAFDLIEVGRGREVLEFFSAIDAGGFA